MAILLIILSVRRPRGASTTLGLGLVEIWSWTDSHTHSHTNKPPTAGVQLVGHTSINNSFQSPSHVLRIKCFVLITSKIYEAAGTQPVSGIHTGSTVGLPLERLTGHDFASDYFEVKYLENTHFPFLCKSKLQCCFSSINLLYTITYLKK